MKKLYCLIPVLCIIGIMTLLISCALFRYPDVYAESNYSGSGDEVFHIDTERSVDLIHTLHLGSYVADVYYVFTNTTPYLNRLHPEIKRNEYSLEETREMSFLSGKYGTGPIGIAGKPEISAYNRDVSLLLTKGTSSRNSLAPLPGPLKDIVDGPAIDFKYDLDSASVSAVCKYSAGDGGTTNKTLNIYVAEDCWAGGPKEKTYEITQAMVDELAAKFLAPGAGNDINDWITAIFGQEWGPHSLPESLIPYNEEDINITILLYDIDNDNVPTGPFVMGFFWAKDNFLQSEEPGSNQRIMFYVDAVMYANHRDSHNDPGNGVWDITDYWPNETISTLAHEFQHMIHYYQKAIKTGNDGYNSEIWIDEICASAAEDFVADKILADGPRGVAYDDYTAGNPGNSYGRLPRFNYTNDYSLTMWDNELYNYSTVYAFGAYLARNFGGVQFFQNLIRNPSTNYLAFNLALSAGGYPDEDFAGLLQKWGTSILLSDNTSPPGEHYQYNSGSSFVSTASSIDFYLGSINLYNYTYTPLDGPYIYTSSPVGFGAHIFFNSASNRLYLVGENLTGDVEHRVRMDNGVKLTVVVKE